MIEKLPPWASRGPREREQMIAWVNQELDEQLFNTGPSAEDAKEFDLWVSGDGPALYAAAQNDIEPLRKRYPHLARFLHLPKVGRGEYLRKNPEKDAANMAADDVPRIRALWKRRLGKKNRRYEDGPSATTIAAERWDVSEDEVIRKMK